MRVWMLAVCATGCGLQEAVTLAEDPTTTEPVATVDCTAMVVNECETFTGCTTIFGRPLRQALNGGFCYDAQIPLEPVACRFSNVDCGFALSFARAPNDLLWWFPDECIPGDHDLFTEANPGDCEN